MARGYPDWGVLPQQMGSADVDMAELAARLGSPYVFTRTGRVIFMDMFKTGLHNWDVADNPNVGEWNITTEYGYGSPGAALLTMINNTTASYSLRTGFPAINAGRWGVEVLFRALSSGYAYKVSILVYDNSSKYDFTFAVIPSNGNISVKKSDGNFQVIGTQPIGYTSVKDWSLVKMVVDASLKTYSYVRFEDVLYNNITVTPYITAVAESDRSLGILHEVTLSLLQGDALAIGSTIVTMDEP